MFDPAFELKLTRILGSLSEVPLKHTSRRIALKQITDIGKEMLGATACSLVFINLEEKSLTIEASSGFDNNFEQQVLGKPIKLGSLEDGDLISFELAKKGEPIELYDLDEDSQGVASTKMIREHHLRAFMAYPMKSGERLIGYFNYFTSISDNFNRETRDMLKIFAQNAVLTINRFEQSLMFERTFSIMNQLSQNLLSVSSTDFLQQIVNNTCDLLSVPVCVLWQHEPSAHSLVVVATSSNVDEDYKVIELDLKIPGMLRHFEEKRVGYLSNVTKAHSLYKHSEYASKRGWVSMVSTPLEVEGRLIGMLDVYTLSTRYFKEWEKELFATFANYAALFIKKTNDAVSRSRVEALNEIMLEMTKVNQVDTLLKLVLTRGLKLIECERGWISRLDYKSGELRIVEEMGHPPKRPVCKIGEGITGQALKLEKTIRVNDIRSNSWKDIYIKCWPDTKSEMAVPILINNVEGRVERQKEYITKPIAVFNVESSSVRAFSLIDEDLIKSLMRHAAIMIERREFDRMFRELAKLQKEIVGIQDWDHIIRILIAAIIETIGYDYVNISLVNPETHRIKTEYVTGFPEKDIEDFKCMADHSLDSNDIQAHIVKTKKIEVPDQDDPRIDSKILERFKHHGLRRVFVPMVNSSDQRVIGTVEAGYMKKYPKHIYETDIQILAGFVDYAVRALEHRNRGLLDRINHEFRSPIVGVKSNASFLQRRISELEPTLINQKFNDILADCEMLLHQVRQLDHILGGGSSPTQKRTRVKFYRDIIIKSVNQLKPLVTERQLNPEKIEYRIENLKKMPPIFADRVQLNEVTFNLLTNAIKYAEDEPEEFTIRIQIVYDRVNYIVQVKDWGIGIDDKFRAKIFEDGFRTPFAREKNISGSGLGLTISKKIMQQMGGDLTLASSYKPTEFHMILPKKLSEVTS